MKSALQCRCLNTSPQHVLSSKSMVLFRYKTCPVRILQGQERLTHAFLFLQHSSLLVLSGKRDAFTYLRICIIDSYVVLRKIKANRHVVFVKPDFDISVIRYRKRNIPDSVVDGEPWIFLGYGMLGVSLQVLSYLSLRAFHDRFRWSYVMFVCGLDGRMS